MVKRYLYDLIKRYLTVRVLPEDRVFELAAREKSSAPVDTRRGLFAEEGNERHTLTDSVESLANFRADRVVVGDVNYHRDLLPLFKSIREKCQPDARLIILYYSALWKPLVNLATALGLRNNLSENNWLTHEDLENLLHLSDFQPVHRERRVLCPLWIPLVSDLINRYLSPLPIFNSFNLINIIVSRPIPTISAEQSPKPSVSIVVPARNEALNIEPIARNLPPLGPDDELIFIEGGSSDDTWEKIQEIEQAFKGKRTILTARQDGKGKGDAVRKGFAMASKDILMIYDADMTVPAEELPDFYEAIVSGKGEFINGCRLVYPMENRAMRFCNVLGNKFFAIAFTYVLGQSFKDTLCGTKVITRDNYLKLAEHRSFFGDFDPFGDFDLIFGAVRMSLKIIELPVHYKERTYGDTNISRWRHGVILFRMLIFSARKLMFL